MKIFSILLLCGCLSGLYHDVSAHGGVGMEDDKCVINIGFLKAHFTGYQPKTNGTEEFCEDIPKVGNSVFVIDFLHDFLKEMQVDFRIVRDINNIGIFANWDDIAGFDDIEQITVFYQPAVTRPNGVLTVNYNFEQGGGYIGIVTAVHPEMNKTYRAVFFFEVGSGVNPFLPLQVALVIVLLAVSLYWLSVRRTNKISSRSARSK